MHFNHLRCFLLCIITGAFCLECCSARAEECAKSKSGYANASLPSNGLAGYWPLQGDSKDQSGKQHDAINHRVDLASGEFNGRDSYLEIPHSKDFEFGKRDFSISAWVDTEKSTTDVIGDIVSKFDPALRLGLNFSISSSNSGYNSICNSRNIMFGIDCGTSGQWIDCGHPNEKTNVTDSLTVYKNELYVGTCDGPTEKDWARVYKYKGNQSWEDCGRLGNEKTQGVLAMIVHDGELYAATTNSHPAAKSAQIEYGSGRVYHYLGGQQWEDIGQPGANYRLNAMASFRGKLYVSGGISQKHPGFVYVYDGDQKWHSTGEFKGLPHALTVHNDRLYAGYPQGEVYSYDGNSWTSLGNPLGRLEDCNQIHAMGVFQGELYVGSWPLGKMSVWRNEKWIDLGRLGDATEIIGVTPYNGSLYIGTIPRAEVFRFDGKDRWTSVGRLFNPKGFEPVQVGSKDINGVKDWSRASSLAVYQGRLFCSVATCMRTRMEKPLIDDPRGKVFSYSAGNAVTYDDDIGHGLKHLAAIRNDRKMKIFVDGKLVAAADATDQDITNEKPLLIGFGQHSHFSGKIQKVRIYTRALTEDEITLLSQEQRSHQKN